jgi:hypothetical protein
LRAVRDSRPSRRRWAARVAAIGLAFTTPVAAWWLIGDQSTVPVSAHPDYRVRPFALGRTAELIVGAGALGFAIVAILWLLWASLRRFVDPRWWSVLVPLLAAGVLLGYGWRVLSAGVIGANIGAGLVMFVICPVEIVLLAFGLARSVVLLNRAHRRRLPPGA